MLGNGDAETTERQAEARTVSHRSEIIDRPQDHEGQFSPRTTVKGRWALDCAHPFGKGSEWGGIVYGRIVRVSNLNEDCGAGGCGGDNVPLAIITEPYNVHRLGDEATPLPADK